MSEYGKALLFFAAFCAVTGWAADKGIFEDATQLGQAHKTLEEALEQSSHELYTEADEKRMDVVGQNGPTAERYIGGPPLE